MRRVVTRALLATVLLCIVWLMRASRLPDTPEVAREPGPEGDGPSPPSVIADSDADPLPDILIDPAIVIEKSTRSLVVFSAGAPVKRYRVGLGSAPIGDKEQEGDGRTPEGRFYVCAKNGESRYRRALGLSYPSEEHAERGLAAGVITRREYRQIIDAVAHFRQPPWRTALGGEIMIHGNGSGNDWTAGCIALEDGEIDELFIEIPLGTPVEIRP